MAVTLEELGKDVADLRRAVVGDLGEPGVLGIVRRLSHEVLGNGDGEAGLKQMVRRHDKELLLLKVSVKSIKTWLGWVLAVAGGQFLTLGVYVFRFWVESGKAN